VLKPPRATAGPRDEPNGLAISSAFPFSVAQVFSGREGKQVAVADTVRGFKEILEGKHDDVPEGNFYMKGAIEEIKQG